MKPVERREDMARVWAEAYNLADPDALASLYEPDCLFAARTGHIRGRAAIRDHFAKVLRSKTKIEHRTRKLVDHGEIALWYGEWRLHAVAADGAPQTRSGSSVEVLRRQPDGSWLYIIDDPNTGETRGA